MSSQEPGLSRDWDYTSIRTETNEAFGRLFAKADEADRKVADRVAEVAKTRGIPRAQIALAWLLSKPVITAPIVGAPPSCISSMIRSLQST